MVKVAHCREGYVESSVEIIDDEFDKEERRYQFIVNQTTDVYIKVNFYGRRQYPVDCMGGQDATQALIKVHKGPANMIGQEYSYFWDPSVGLFLKDLVPGKYELRVTPEWHGPVVRDATIRLQANHDVGLGPVPETSEDA